MEISFEKLPDGWDPRTIVLMCCDRAVVMASRETDGAVCMYRASGGYLNHTCALAPGSPRRGGSVLSGVATTVCAARFAVSTPAVQE
jgi:hypothetical protein